MKRLLYALPIGFVAVMALILIVTRGGVAIGMVILDRAFLDGQRAPEKPITFTAIGVAEIPADVTPEIAARHIGSLRVVGLFRADHRVREALAGRVTVTGTATTL